MNLTGAAINPYTDPTLFCGVVEGAIRDHYQSLLTNYWFMFLAGGFFIGATAMYVYTLWYLHKKGGLIKQNKQ